LNWGAEVKNDQQGMKQAQMRGSRPGTAKKEREEDASRKTLQTPEMRIATGHRGVGRGLD